MTVVAEQMLASASRVVQGVQAVSVTAFGVVSLCLLGTRHSYVDRTEMSERTGDVHEGPLGARRDTATFVKRFGATETCEMSVALLSYQF